MLRIYHTEDAGLGAGCFLQNITSDFELLLQLARHDSNTTQRHNTVKGKGVPLHAMEVLGGGERR
jgi:hypothetical protein